MNPAFKSSLPVALDPIATAILAQLKEKVATQEQALAKKDAQLMRAQQALTLSELKIQKLVEELRLERIKKYGKQSETLSDLQLQMLDLEPAVSSEEIAAESQRGPLPESSESNNTTDKQRRPARIIRAATSCLRIWNGSTRSLPARPSSACAASAAAIPRSSATKFRKCSTGSRLRTS
jgi:hypothetical protein